MQDCKEANRLDMVVRGGTIVTATDIFSGDIGIRDGRIAVVAAAIDSDQAESVVDARGLLVMPGVVDVDTRLQFVTDQDACADDYGTGSLAAAFGGVTTIVDTACQEEAAGLLPSLEQRLKLADGRLYVDYSFHAALGTVSDEVLASMPGAMCYGVPSFFVSTVHDGDSCAASDGELLTLLDATRTAGALATLHAENRSLVEYLQKKLLSEGRESPADLARSRPAFGEAEAVRRAIFYTELVGGRAFFFHLSTTEAARAVGEAKGRGALVFAETCPHYLLLSEHLYEVPDAPLYVTTPPLRGEADLDGLWKGIAAGAVQVVSSGHRAFRREQKEKARESFAHIPSGLPGIETLLPLMFSEGVRKGRLGLNLLVELLSSNPARLFGLHPRKGNLVPGADADLVLLDPEKRVRIGVDTLHMASDWSPFEGWVVTGWPRTTICRGRVVVQEGELVGQPGWGQFVPRAYGPGQYETTAPPPVAIS